MSRGNPPWCLRWNRDGELVPSDRRDVLDALIGAEASGQRHRSRSHPLIPSPADAGLAEFTTEPLIDHVPDLHRQQLQQWANATGAAQPADQQLQGPGAGQG